MSKLIIAGNEIIPGTITVTTNNSTITPKDDLRVILNISAVGAVTLSDGTDTTQRVEVFNVSSSACSITYKGSGGNVTYSLRNASGMTLLWTGTYWKATIAGLITGTDANGASINYTSEATIDLHEEPVQYSTTEQDTGKTWIDGKAIYRRIIFTQTYNAYTANSIITDLKAVTKIYGVTTVTGTGVYHPIPSAHTAIDYTIGLAYNPTSGLYVIVGSQLANRIPDGVYITIEYTKST